MVNDWEAQFCCLFYVVSHNASEDCSMKVTGLLALSALHISTCKMQDLQSSSHLGHNQTLTLRCVCDVGFLNCNLHIHMLVHIKLPRFTWRKNANLQSNSPLWSVWRWVKEFTGPRGWEVCLTVVLKNRSFGHLVAILTRLLIVLHHISCFVWILCEL